MAVKNNEILTHEIVTRICCFLSPTSHFHVHEHSRVYFSCIGKGKRPSMRTGNTRLLHQWLFALSVTQLFFQNSLQIGPELYHDWSELNCQTFLLAAHLSWDLSLHWQLSKGPLNCLVTFKLEVFTWHLQDLFPQYIIKLGNVNFKNGSKIT